MIALSKVWPLNCICSPSVAAISMGFDLKIKDNYICSLYKRKSNKFLSSTGDDPKYLLSVENQWKRLTVAKTIQQVQKKGLGIYEYVCWNQKGNCLVWFNIPLWDTGDSMESINIKGTAMFSIVGSRTEMETLQSPGL